MAILLKLIYTVKALIVTLYCMVTLITPDSSKRTYLYLNRDSTVSDASVALTMTIRNNQLFSRNALKKGAIKMSG